MFKLNFIHKTMARIGCKVLLRNICFTNFSPILLANKQLYYHPIIMSYDDSIENKIKIGDRIIMTCIYAWYYGISIQENKYRMNLYVGKSLEPVCFINHNNIIIRIYKNYQYENFLHEALSRMLSIDIFRICIPMFEYYKANTN
jgi:hypothetical protein